MTGWLEWVNAHIFGVFVPLFLLAAGLLFLFRLRRYLLVHPLRAVRTVLSAGSRRKGESVRALCMALSGTLGVGNISGVALAIALGGAGAIFWMWVSALLAMLLKYAEIVLAMACRPAPLPDGGRIGGAMYYIRAALPGRCGRALAAFFSFLCIGGALTLGSMVQSGAIAECMHGVFGIPPPVAGGVLFLLTAIVVFGGAKKISAITLRLIPAMTFLYIALSLTVIFCNLDRLPAVIGRIFAEAFSPAAAAGGGAGFLSLRALRFGVARGLLSNEAGCGTAPMAHATADNTPVAQGLCGIAEVFVDTLVLCSMTAFVVLLAFPVVPKGGGAMLAICAYSVFIGKGAGWMIALSLFVFAYGTAVCWAYYGENGIRYLLGNGVGIRRLYYFVFCLFLVVGSVFTSAFIWGLTDALLSVMTILNVTVLCLSADRVVALTAKELPLAAPHSRRKKAAPTATRAAHESRT